MFLVLIQVVVVRGSINASKQVPSDSTAKFAARTGIEVNWIPGKNEKMGLNISR